jgi:hypothetical protein
VVKLDVSVDDVLVASLANVVISTYYLQHYFTGNRSAFPSALFSLGSAAFGEENRARVAEDLARHVLGCIVTNLFKLPGSVNL